MKRMRTYLYALYDEGDGQAHSGLTEAYGVREVLRDIEHNYRAPKYVTVQWVKERDAGQEAQA